ncbi:MAG: hypothetical protein KGO96_07035 [Elusimicrobia bacterium]|nr:hypothetical protein [Elusimicrobiota bacterium]
MTKVYRYEDKKGKGPYNGLGNGTKQAENLSEELRNKHENTGIHPGFIKDFYWKYSLTAVEAEKFKYGFLTKEQAFDWFEGYISELEICGWELKECEAETVLVGESGKQVMFK